LGKSGAGLLEQENLNQTDVPILMATLGKAIGTAGAFVAGSNDLIEYLVQTARTYTYTTAMPPAIAAATRASLKLVQRENDRRERLNQHIQQFKKGADDLDIELMPSDTAIQPIMIGSTERAIQISKKLQNDGILVTAIRPPTIPEGTARLRVTLSTEHTTKDIVILLEALSKHAQEI
jgi:8-amino-7-oxononanoate synthase